MRIFIFDRKDWPTRAWAAGKNIQFEGEYEFSKY
jgi:hypothetical protein